MKKDRLLSIVDSIVEKQEKFGEVILVVGYIYLLIFLIRACL